MCRCTDLGSRRLSCMAAPTRAKRRLGKYLVELRTAVHATTVEAAEVLRSTDSTVSRYESGHVLPVWATVRALVDFYGGGTDEVLRAQALWDDARDEAPPVRLPAGTPRSFRRLVTAEREATRIQEISPSVVPGLLQTEDYVQALNAPLHYSGLEARVDDVVSVRLRRQERLSEADDPLGLHVVLDEAVIRRVVGGPDVMRRQLHHLLAQMERPNVTVQVVPFSTGAYGTMTGACTIVHYPEPDEPSVYLEYPAGGTWVENREDVDRFIAMHGEVSKVALSHEQSADMIKERMRKS